jgi:predicted permease
MKKPWNLRWRTSRERELDEELRLHLEMETENNRRAGMPEAEARAAARRTLGSMALIKDEVRDSWGSRFWDSLKGDVRIGLRGLRRSPGFTAVVILTMALGIGTNSAIFSVVYGVLLRPLPYAAGDRLMRVKQEVPAAGIDDLSVSAKEIADYRSQAKSFDGIAEYHTMWFSLLGRGEPLRVQTGVVSANFFDVLGVRPILGRTFAAGEDAHGAQPVLVLSYGFWQRAFGADPGIIGQTFEMNDRPHVVVGVLPPIPLYPNENDVFMPTSACPFRSSERAENNRRARMSLAFGRLAPDATVGQAKAELAAIAGRMRAANPGDYNDKPSLTATALPVSAELTEGGRTRLLFLLAVAGFVLLIVCANVANLTLARGMRRKQEMAVRAALGANRMRLVRQLLTEGMILALCGGAVGLLAAAWGRDLLVQFAGRFSPRAQEIHVDQAVAVFTLVVSLATGLVFAAVPALPSPKDIAAAMRDDGARTVGGRGRLRSALVVVQVAFSFVLLIGAGLMLRSLIRLEDLDPGFHADHVLTMRLDLDWAKYRGPGKEARIGQIGAYQRVLDGVRGIPGVADAAVATTFPLATVNPFSGQYQIEGQAPASPEQRPGADQLIASPSYFGIIGVPIIAGRAFSTADTVDAPPVIVVNQALVRRQFGGVDPIGRRSPGSWATRASSRSIRPSRRPSTGRSVSAAACPPACSFAPTVTRATSRGTCARRCMPSIRASRSRMCAASTRCARGLWRRRASRRSSSACSRCWRSSSPRRASAA